MFFDRSTGTVEHQDSWYLDTDPPGNLVGVWYALEDIQGPTTAGFEEEPEKANVTDIVRLAAKRGAGLTCSFWTCRTRC